MFRIRKLVDFWKALRKAALDTAHSGIGSYGLVTSSSLTRSKNAKPL